MPASDMTKPATCCTELLAAMLAAPDAEEGAGALGSATFCAPAPAPELALPLLIVFVVVVAGMVAGCVCNPVAGVTTCCCGIVAGVVTAAGVAELLVGVAAVVVFAPLAVGAPGRPSKQSSVRDEAGQACRWQIKKAKQRFVGGLIVLAHVQGEE